MKKIIIIITIAAVAALAAVNVIVAFGNNNGVDLSLNNIEALAWIEIGPDQWLPEPGDKIEDITDYNNHPANNSIEYDMKNCATCVNSSGPNCSNYQYVVVQYFYCASSSSNTSCNQSDVDFRNATQLECVEPYNW